MQLPSGEKIVVLESYRLAWGNEKDHFMSILWKQQYHSDTLQPLASRMMNNPSWSGRPPFGPCESPFWGKIRDFSLVHSELVILLAAVWSNLDEWGYEIRWRAWSLSLREALGCFAFRHGANGCLRWRGALFRREMGESKRHENFLLGSYSTPGMSDCLLRFAFRQLPLIAMAGIRCFWFSPHVQ
jgi:hypothetical protein